MKTINQVKRALMMVFLPTVLGSVATAQIQFQSASFIGTGCPQRKKTEFVPSTTVTVADNRISILFDEFIVDSTKTNRSTCKILIPVKVEENYQISLKHVETEGYLKQSLNSETTARALVRFSNKPDAHYQLAKDWYGLIDESFNLKNVISRANTQLWSDCGQRDFFIVLDYEMNFKMKDNSVTNFATFDSSEYQAQWRYCRP